MPEATEPTINTVKQPERLWLIVAGKPDGEWLLKVTADGRIEYANDFTPERAVAAYEMFLAQADQYLRRQSYCTCGTLDERVHAESCHAHCHSKDGSTLCAAHGKSYYVEAGALL